MRCVQGSTLTPWNTVNLKVSALHLTANSLHHFMRRLCLLTYPQEPATSPSSEPDESRSLLPKLFNAYFNLILPSAFTSSKKLHPSSFAEQNSVRTSRVSSICYNASTI
jgi:hypothetical protein